MKARLKEELGQTGGSVSVFWEMLPKRGTVVWLALRKPGCKGCLSLPLRFGSRAFLAHCGLLASESPAAGQKSPLQLIMRQILKKSSRQLCAGGRLRSTADLPSGSLPSHWCWSKGTFSIGVPPPVTWLSLGCREVCGVPRVHGASFM